VRKLRGWGCSRAKANGVRRRSLNSLPDFQDPAHFRHKPAFLHATWTTAAQVHLDISSQASILTQIKGVKNEW